MKRIIFVDDDINLLEGLKRMLRKKTDLWDMLFIRSPKEALDLIGKYNFDVIVTDYKMPEMNGLELLTAVKKINKSIKRIVLSGQSEMEIFKQANELADAYIPKPTQSGDLIEILEKFTVEMHE